MDDVNWIVIPNTRPRFLEHETNSSKNIVTNAIQRRHPIAFYTFFRVICVYLFLVLLTDINFMAVSSYV